MKEIKTILELNDYCACNNISIIIHKGKFCGLRKEDDPAWK